MDAGFLIVTVGAGVTLRGVEGVSPGWTDSEFIRFLWDGRASAVLETGELTRRRGVFEVIAVGGSRKNAEAYEPFVVYEPDMTIIDERPPRGK